MEVKTEYISAACNCTYNCMELGDTFILYGSNRALAIYDLLDERVTSTFVAHGGRVNCLRFIRNTLDRHDFVVSCCTGGILNLWTLEESPTSKPSDFKYSVVAKRKDDRCNTVCSGIQLQEDSGTFIVGCISSESEVFLYSIKNSGPGSEIILIQDIRLNKALSNELVFHAFDSEGIIMALGMDSGAVKIYDFNGLDKSEPFVNSVTLQKHEDWVRCIDFITLENGDTLMASGGQDSFIAVWRFTKSKSEQSSFEFQVHQYKDFQIVFDSMIIGHEGWVNSLHWNSQGELLSCSSDQSIIIWQSSGDIWMEKTRLGVMGGMIPGGCCAKFFGDHVATSGFQGAVQIWADNDGEWELRPSLTGHFQPISDMDYDNNGNFVVTTSEDQTTRAHALWGPLPSRWHEISRPQIHGHDLFACRTIGEMIVSGAEEKILRAFQPTEVFYKNLEDSSLVKVAHNDAAKAAFLPALGLSNQTEDNSANSAFADLPLSTRLDEDFIRSQTLWLEVSKLYGHVYEIACIATSPVEPLIASASHATQQKFAAIILWCAKRWKNLGEFPHHKLNVTGMEFSPDGSRLLSVSRDRTWVVWKVLKMEDSDFRIEVLSTGGVHTRALWVGTWSPSGEYFLTGARDKKLMVWKKQTIEGDEKYELVKSETFQTSVSAAAANSDNIIAVGLENGEMELLQYNLVNSELTSLLKLDKSNAHHDTIKRLKFNPTRKSQLASAGADGILKILEISTP